MLSIDLNCDMGESTTLWQYSIEKDMRLLRYVSSVNLACGFHAGDAHTMHELADAALTAGIAIGAHPGFEDRENFGRTNKTLAPGRIYDIIIYQLGALDAFLRIHGTRLHHVKPHGALYNMAAADGIIAEAICRAVKDFDERLILYGLSGSQLINAANAIGLQSRSEVFADRTYTDAGTLTPRSQPNALLASDTEAVGQVLQMIQQGTVTASSGKQVPIVAETICLHGDGEHALPFAQRISETLKQQGIETRPD
jgi:UPF0271 protein